MSLGSRYDMLHLGNLKPKKIWNFLKCIFLKKRKNLSYYPITYIIDPSTICNLKCPFCFQGKYDSEVHLKKELMSYNDFLNILGKIKNHALIIYLYNFSKD